MSTLGRVLAVSVTAAALAGASAAPSSAVVGGNDASPGEYPAVAEITFGPFLCTGTLLAPDWVLSAGHCGSVTGAAVATPASWPPQLINVRVGGVSQTDGEQRSVSRVVMHPNYLLTSGYDISLLQLSQSSTMAPTKVAGAGERSIWTAGTLETIVGWGATEEGGEVPDNLQEAQVPITTDAYCAGAYSDFDPQTMVCAGFPQGGVDTCQGDSGGPMFGRTSTGALRVVGATSFGEGCARPDRPGVYARVADNTLRPWIAQNTESGVAAATTTSSALR
jgi:secreted trypsin-like serine protease